MKIFYTFFILFFSTLSFAHEIKNISQSGFGGPVIKMTDIYDRTTPMIGVKGAYLIDHSFYVGGAGYSVANNNEYESPTVVNQKYNFSYIGLIVGHLFTPSRDFHLNTQLLFGSAITFLYEPNSGKPIELSEAKYGFVGEAEIGVLYDVNQFLKIELSGGFRYVHPIKYFTSKELNGYSLNLGFWFGKY